MNKVSIDDVVEICSLFADWQREYTQIKVNQKTGQLYIPYLKLTSMQKKRLAKKLSLLFNWEEKYGR